MALKFPPIYLVKFQFHKNPDELHRLEKEIGVVWDIKEAKLVLGKISQKQRARHELRLLGLDTEEVVEVKRPRSTTRGENFSLPSGKRRKRNSSTIEGKDVIDLASNTESETESALQSSNLVGGMPQPAVADRSSPLPGPELSATSAEYQTKVDEDNVIRVLKLAWYTDSLKAGALLPYDDYLLYTGRIKNSPPTTAERKPTKLPHSGSILSRARADTPPARNYVRFHQGGKVKSPPRERKSQGRHIQLLHEDSEEHEIVANLPPIPEYLKTRWSCQRPTPLHSPNDAFLAQLTTIRQARKLESNEIAGHGFADKAYSGAIATIASYPYTITSIQEILRLPSCGGKIAALWQEWKETRRIKEVEDIEADSRMKCLNIFYGIYQVGESHAREFYAKGWRELNDVIEKGWDTLTRDQQIGVKFYDELQLRIPRSEVEATGKVVLDHANALCPGFQMVIVGGYRRGKPDSGDMDFVLSHPDEHATEYFLNRLLDSLVLDKWVVYDLTVSTRNSERGQEALFWKGNTKGRRRTNRSGFDTLDRAFIVWRDPNFTPAPGDTALKNPNLHRRVDIIISPWKTAGCAVLGWTGGTMFERDLRSYCRKELGWKFDSSGVRDLETGEWIDLEGDAMDMYEKEKRVFKGLELEWREPTERCTH